MTIRFYFAVFISAAAFSASENNGTGLTISAIPRARVRDDGVGVGSRKNQTDEKTKRAISASERDSILNAFNCGRSRLGASDITYMSWSTSSEDEVYNFVQACDFDAKFTSSTSNYAFLRRAFPTNIGHKRVIDGIFETDTPNTVTSKYVIQVGGAYKDCTSAGGHFYAYKLSGISGFNPTVTQYTTGSACTSCDAGVNWCYNNLCREDCSSSSPGCCPITNNVPAQCESSDPICKADPAAPDSAGSGPAGSDAEKAVNTVKPVPGSSSTEVKASVMMLVIVSAFNYYFM